MYKKKPRHIKIESLIFPEWDSYEKMRSGAKADFVNYHKAKKLIREYLSDDEWDLIIESACSFVFDGTDGRIDSIGSPHLKAIWKLLRRQIDAPVVFDQLSKASRGLTVEERFSILQRDGFRCAYCGRSAPEVELHVDHIFPLSKGGQNVSSNLITACRECNEGKSDKILDGRREQ